MQLSQLTGDTVMGANETGDWILLETGRMSIIKAFGLPLSKWRDRPAVTGTYNLEGAKRINLSDLSAADIMRIVAYQVDENWKPSACAVLTFSGRDMMLIVPANPYWRTIVQAEGDTS